MKKLMFTLLLLIVLLVSSVVATTFTNSDGSVIVSVKDKPANFWEWLKGSLGLMAVAGTYTSSNCLSSVCFSAYNDYYIYNCIPNSDGSQCSCKWTSTKCPSSGATTFDKMIGSATTTTTPATTPTTTTSGGCSVIDSDGNNPSVKGYAQVGTSSPVYDKCYDSSHSYEAYCDTSFNSIFFSSLGCLSGTSCSDGACGVGTAPPTVSGCTDSDISSQYSDGKNPYLLGTVTVKIGTYEEKHQDFCTKDRTDMVNEEFCNPTTNDWDYIQITCPLTMWCNNGACIDKTNECDYYGTSIQRGASKCVGFDNITCSSGGTISANINGCLGGGGNCKDNVDGDINKFIAGTAIDGEDKTPDRCDSTGKILFESYCKDSRIAITDIACEAGCKDGACIDTNKCEGIVGRTCRTGTYFIWKACSDNELDLGSKDCSYGRTCCELVRSENCVSLGGTCRQSNCAGDEKAIGNLNCGYGNNCCAKKNVVCDYKGQTIQSGKYICNGTTNVTCDYAGNYTEIKNGCEQGGGQPSENITKTLSASLPYTEWMESPAAQRMKTLCKDKTDCDVYEDLAGTGKEYYVECKSVSQIQTKLQSDVDEICKKGDISGYFALGGGAAGFAAGCWGGALVGAGTAAIPSGGLLALPGAITGCIIGGVTGSITTGVIASGAQKGIGTLMYLSCKDKTVPKDVGACMAIPKGQTFGQFQWCDIAGKVNFIKFSDDECGSGTINALIYLVVGLLVFGFISNSFKSK